MPRHQNLTRQETVTEYQTPGANTPTIFVRGIYFCSFFYYYRTFATLALTILRSNHSARSHPHRILNTRLCSQIRRKLVTRLLKAKHWPLTPKTETLNTEYQTRKVKTQKHWTPDSKSQDTVMHWIPDSSCQNSDSWLADSESRNTSQWIPDSQDPKN